MTQIRATPIDLSRLRRVHLVGIGGMHMSAIAGILLSRGVQVTGSDIAPSRYTERLEREGATVYTGHDADFLGDADLVITTVAAKDSNPELAAARERGLPIVIRAEMVAALMEGLTAICVAGTHGKTTTSSLIAFALTEARRHPTYLLGGDSVNLGRNAAPGTGPEIVVEADEYAEAFLHYRPDVALVTNVEADHLDYFGTEARVVGAFAAFLERVRPDGLAVVCLDSPHLRGLVNGSGPVVPHIACRIESYALDRPADWTALVGEAGPDEQRFEVFHHGKRYGRFSTGLAGRHNVANCLGATAALHARGLAEEEIRHAIRHFRGVRRRFELVGEVDGIIVVDDYAHHPTEVAATLAAARQRFPGRRLVTVFQPHTYSRTSYLLDGFRTCFTDADALLLLQTYAARETADAGMDGAQLAALVREPKPGFAATPQDAVAWLLANSQPGDVIFTIGAGTVDGVGRDFLAQRRKARDG